ncbi:MAG: SsrA-binding protein SmpB [Ruminococcaceae bacterium]|nr:SsrA-binding protein SmpB [Oscillospiraceae bacterium]
MEKDSIKLIAQNKKAFHDFFIEETYECGIELVGTEVKSLREGRVNLKDSYASISNGEVYIKNMHISPYEKGNIFNKDPLRERKLLLHKYEILKLVGKIKEKGYSLIPTKVYLKNSLMKVELALAKGKKLYDKREDIARKDAKRDMERKLKDYNK